MRSAAKAEDEDEDEEDDEEADAEDDAGAVAAADEDDDMDADEEENEDEDDDEEVEEDAAVRGPAMAAAAAWCRNTAVLTSSPASTSKLCPNTFFHSAICPLRAWARACSSIACSNLDLAASTVPSMATRAGYR